MTDIVERLRDAAPIPTGLYCEAADEIERLREELAECERERDELIDEWRQTKDAMQEYQRMWLASQQELAEYKREELDAAVDAVLAKLGDDEGDV